MIELADQQWDALTTCPDWCTGNHKDGDRDIDGASYHPRPIFGDLLFSGTTRPDGTVAALGAAALANDFDTPEELRQLAANAWAAAAWLEAQSSISELSVPHPTL